MGTPRDSTRKAQSFSCESWCQKTPPCVYFTNQYRSRCAASAASHPAVHKMPHYHYEIAPHDNAQAMRSLALSFTLARPVALYFSLYSSPQESVWLCGLLAAPCAGPSAPLPAAPGGRPGAPPPPSLPVPPVALCVRPCAPSPPQLHHHPLPPHSSAGKIHRHHRSPY